MGYLFSAKAGPETIIFSPNVKTRNVPPFQVCAW